MATDTIEGYYPVGHLCVEAIGGRVVRSRFVYDADVRRISARLRQLYPAADAHGLDTVVSFYILRLGPEHPALVAAVADDLGLGAQSPAPRA
jgi:hypothetical protein